MANQQIVKDSDSRELDAAPSAGPRYVTPAVDIYENDAEYLLLADLPGVEPAALSVELEANELRILGKRPAGDTPQYVYRRSFQVGPGVDPNGISAALEHGVLKLTAKKSAALKPRQIAVKAA